MGYTDLHYAVTAGVATITISRPDRRNALRIETYAELAAALEEAGADGQVGVVVITGPATAPSRPAVTWRWRECGRPRPRYAPYASSCG